MLQIQIQVPAIRRSGVNTPTVQPTAPEGCRDDTGAVQGNEHAIHRQMPNIKKISKIVEITHAVTHGQVPNIAKTEEIPQAQFMPRRCTTNSCAETEPNAQEIQTRRMQQCRCWLRKWWIAPHFDPPPDGRNVTIAAVPRWSLKETPRPTMIQYIDKIVGVPRRVKDQVTTAQCGARQMLAIHDVQSRRSLAGNGIVMARYG